MRNIILLIGATLSGTLALSALAAVSPDEARQLEGPVLTPFGAEKAGNKDGTIPAYTGESIKVPACFNPKEPGNYCDPFNEKPIVTITAQNMAEYADKLTDGQKEMLKKYPTYKMAIYPTHRTHIYPKYVIDNTIKNATSCLGIEGDMKLQGCYGGLPFPIPKNGTQVMWNHLLAYNSYLFTGENRSLFVDTSGKAMVQSAGEVVNTMFFYDPKVTTPHESNSVYKGIRLDTSSPARRSGEKIVVLNYLNNEQRVYQYLPGQRRVKLAPDVAYDTPNPESAGGATMDQTNIFFGQLDRYDFKLIGKTEKYIVYNDFIVSDYKRCPQEVYATKNFPNPDCTRWELHRVWQVQATLKAGNRHILPKRTFYFDEDNPSAGTGDSYDSAGKLYRVDDMNQYPFYDLGYGGMTQANTSIDVQMGSWALDSYGGFQGGGYHPAKTPMPPTFWSPDGMAGEGIR